MTVQGASSINSPFEQDGSVLVQGLDGPQHATLTAASSFSNAGTITLQTLNGTWSSNLAVTSGTLTNTGTISTSPGSGGSRTVSANLANSGTVTINTDTTFSQASGVYTNTGTFAIAAGKALTISGQNQAFNQNAGTLTSTGAFDLHGSVQSATFNFNGGTATDNPLLLANAALNIGPGAIAAASFKMRGNSTLSGDVAAGTTIVVEGLDGPQHATLTAASSFSNAGTITLQTLNGTWSSNLAVTSGTLTNTGTISTSPGSGGSRTVSANLANSGTVTINTDTTFSQASGVYTNTGTVAIADGKTLTISGNNQVFNQNDGTLTSTGTFDLRSATFNFSGGTPTGNPLLLTNAALNIDPAATAAASFTMRGGSTLSGNVAAGQTILVQGLDGPQNATLTAASDFSNAGTITLQTLIGTWSSNLAVTSGTLTNTGTINSNPGSGGSRTLSLELNNQGTVNIGRDTTLTKDSAAHINSGMINVSGGSLTVLQTGTNPTFTNNGTLNISAGSTVNISGGSLTNFNAGTLTGGTYIVAGTFKFPSAAITVNAATIVLDGAGSAIVDQANNNALLNFSTNDNAGSFTIQNGRNFTTAADFTNNGTLTIGVGSTFSVNGSYTQSSMATLEVQLGGTPDTGQLGQLIVTGMAALDGTLTATQVNGYTPTTGDTFAVLTYGSRNGDFATGPNGFDHPFDDANGVMSLVAQ
jgi:hypothetical protein